MKSLSLPAFTNCEFYLSLLNVLKYMGTFPIQLECDQREDWQCKWPHSITGVSCIKGGLYFWLNRVGLAWLSVHSFIQLMGLFAYWLEDEDLENPKKEFVFVLSWTLNYSIRILILVQFAARKESFCEMLTKWLHLERTILKLREGNDGS